MSTEDPLKSRKATLTSQDLATLVYTSGTTGVPKGVMLSHGNLVSNVLGAYSLLDLLDIKEKLMLSFLPLSHIFERTCGYYVAIHYGFTVAFAESPTTLIDNMAEVKPTLLISVPRIYEKLYTRVMDSAGSGVKRKLMDWALSVGKAYSTLLLAQKNIPWGLQLQQALATRLVFSKIRQRMGGRLKYAISGGAPLSPEIAEFVNATGLNVFEGYGLSETSPIIAANRPGAFKIGSVGKPWPGVEIRIAPEPGRERDGEVWVRGPNVMLGYFKKPAETAEVLDHEGWLHTGDIGYLDSDGLLHLTDRKKELIKTAGGKYVAPQMIENLLKVNPLVEQTVIVGDRRKYCVALIVPNFQVLEKTLGQSLPSDRLAIQDDSKVISILQDAVNKVNAELGSWEQIKCFRILPAEMSQDSGELTPTLKVKRHVVEQKYQSIIESMYTGG